MYAGSTLKYLKYFDAWFGVHQKIDRLAYRNLKQLLPNVVFPTPTQIIKFEGIDGPDGIKRKSPGYNEPSHFFDPLNSDGAELPKFLTLHHQALKNALSKKDTVRASFEAAWLAHAIVDGLTPAHHFPYEEELNKLRGSDAPSRSSVRQKLVIPGSSVREKLHNNWKMWGESGLLSTHIAYEMRVAVLTVPYSFKSVQVTAADLKEFRTLGFDNYFKRVSEQIAAMSTYDAYRTGGWNAELRRAVTKEIMPKMIRTVTLAWHDAATAKAAK